MYNILTLNKIASCGINKFSDNYSCSSDIENPDAVMVRSANMLDMQLSPNTIAIARAGAGTNNIPCDKCAENGIVVFNTPGANANAVKELVICGLLMASRKVAKAIGWCGTLKGEGENMPKLVEKGKSNFAGPEIMGKTLGIIGMGAIGFKVSQACEALGMKIVGYDPFLNDAVKAKLSSNVTIYTDINDLFKVSDYITIHVPLNDATRNTVNADTLSICKDGVRILNFARGGLVDEKAMVDALNSGKAGAYITDFGSDAILGVDGVTVMPHLGASTPESEDNCAMMAADEIMAYLERGEIINSVNMPNLANLGDLNGKRTCVISTDSCADEVKEAMPGAVFASRKGYSYTVANGDFASAVKNIDGVLKIRVI